MLKVHSSKLQLDIQIGLLHHLTNYCWWFQVQVEKKMCIWKKNLRVFVSWSCVEHPIRLKLAISFRTCHFFCQWIWVVCGYVFWGWNCRQTGGLFSQEDGEKINTRVDQPMEGQKHERASLSLQSTTPEIFWVRPSAKPHSKWRTQAFPQRATEQLSEHKYTELRHSFRRPTSVMTCTYN